MCKDSGETMALARGHLVNCRGPRACDEDLGQDKSEADEAGIKERIRRT